MLVLKKQKASATLKLFGKTYVTTLAKSICVSL